MQQIFSFIAAIFAELGVYKYALLFVMASIEGPLVMTTTGFLLHFNQFNFFWAYVMLILGDLTGDFFWYGVGYFVGKENILKYGKYFSLDEAIVTRIKNLFQHHHNKIIFISKVTMGFGFSLATLISAGMSRVSLKKFGLFNLLGGFIWTGLLMGLGYFLGNTYVRINESFKILFLITAGVTIMAVLYGLQRFIRNKFSR